MDMTLESLRRDIDAIDAEMALMLAKRQGLVEKVLLVKQRDGIAARLPDRISAVIEQAAAKAEAAGADPDLARQVWGAMVEWFVRHEERKLGSGAAQNHTGSAPPD